MRSTVRREAGGQRGAPEGARTGAGGGPGGTRERGGMFTQEWKGRRLTNNF